jgi:acetyl-CoA carboxylase carboxyltransferase component
MVIEKTIAHQRILSLLDEGSFVETGALIGSRTADPASDGMGDGVVTGYGTIDGALVFIYAQDPSFEGGSVGEMHARKISALYHKALDMGAPVIALIDTAGVRLTEENESLFSFGRILAHQANISGVVPQLALVMGPCGGGMAVSARMADFVLMEEEHGRLYYNSPNAITGSFEAKLDTSSAVYHTATTGNCDFAGTQDEIFRTARQLISILPHNNEEDYSEIVCTDDLNRAVAGIEKLETKDMLAELADNGIVVEPGADHLKSMRTAFIRLNGRTVGVIANSVDQLCNKGSNKASRFIRFCDAFGIPLLTLVNARRLRGDEAVEQQLGFALSGLVGAYCGAAVPKVTVITGCAYGTAGLVMNSRSLGADLVYAWKDAKLGAMDEGILEDLTGSARTGINDTLHNARRGYIDDIIDPAETRQRVAAAFEMLYSKSVAALPRRHSTV